MRQIKACSKRANVHLQLSIHNRLYCKPVLCQYIGRHPFPYIGKMTHAPNILDPNFTKRMD
jgi:hypothetical protein